MKIKVTKSKVLALLIVTLMLSGFIYAGAEGLFEKDIGLDKSIDYKEAGIDEIQVSSFVCGKYACDFSVDIIKKGDGKDINDTIETTQLTILTYGKSTEQILKEKDDLVKIYTEVKAKNTLDKKVSKTKVDDSYKVDLSKGIKW